jgi:Zn-dependent metalloprotease
MLGRPTLVALCLIAAPLALIPATHAAANPSPAATAVADLRADVHGTVHLQRGRDGRLTFVGTGVGGAVDDPGVSASDTVAKAARTHLDRYGAALGAARGTSYAQGSVVHTVAGIDVVRFDQQVGGVPVLGGQVIVGMDHARGLRSLAAHVSPRATITPSTVPTSSIDATALAISRRAHRDGGLKATDRGRWVLDPTVAGIVVPGGPRTVRRVEVGDGAGVRDLVLVDDHTGRVVFRTSLIENLDRVVCDDANQRSALTSCTSGFARIEGDPATGVTDVDQAYDFAKEVSDFYQQIGGLDLTNLLGISIGGTKKLASTVRFCTNTMSNGTSYDDPCPYPNAFWDGTQMFYGAGYGAADDVVGHEMTHGVIDQFSQLFYWGQSGAINESLADTMGEFVDHRNGTDDDSAWNLGEDLPGGPNRSMKDPTLHGQPDTMTSPNYVGGQADSGGVHTNSGVGTKTAYLISQGTGGVPFNGLTFSGIDGSDTMLTKTSTLYLDVIESLSSGADYADLAAQLQQSCHDLAGAGTVGFTSSDCTIVQQATQATELTTTPPNASQPADASVSCPSGTTKRVLLDSETGTPAQQEARFSHANLWIRGVSADWGSNATSGTDSWFAEDIAAPQSAILKPAAPVALPAGQSSYLSFQGWWLVDSGVDGLGAPAYFDGGAVKVGASGTGGVEVVPPHANWVNGPNGVLFQGSGNPYGGTSAFVGNSNGWVRSRLDLSADQGQSVEPEFIFATDDDGVGQNYSLVGWFLDDMQIYTCDRMPGAVTALHTSGEAILGTAAPIGQLVAWSAPSANPASVSGYRVYVDGVLRATLGRSSRSAGFRGLSTTAKHVFVVRPLNLVGALGPAAATSTVPSTVTLAVVRHGARVTLSGVLRRAGKVFAGQRVRVQRKVGTQWVLVGTGVVTKVPGGTYVVTVTRSTPAIYRVVFAGAGGVTGSLSPARRR